MMVFLTYFPRTTTNYETEQSVIECHGGALDIFSQNKNSILTLGKVVWNAMVVLLTSPPYPKKCLLYLQKKN